ncbi:MAG: TRAP transporter large permease [Akkermansiaceae bacterium]|jgi:tripartite ATP-independent transporter DctM subunit|tara:strand:- start:7293 stop:8597 length:1305 start_codon:yes stop_codon:yes gene_type:complete
MTIGIVILLVVFISLLLLDTPVAFVVGCATVLAAISLGYPNATSSVVSDMANSVSTFALLAIPFFILAGELMGAGGLARRLIDFAASMVGRLPGGLALVNTVTCMLFGAISGSAAAAISSIGNTLIPEMSKKGYPRDFSVAVTSCGSVTGLLIPPSNVMIVFAVVASVSVGDLFIGGILPGILLGVCIMAMCMLVSKKKGYGKTGLQSIPKFLPSFGRAFPSLLLVIIVLGGILGGVFTATEASAIAVVWAFLLSVCLYREVKLKDMPAILSRASRTTAMVLLLVATSSAMSKFLTMEQIPQMVSQAMLTLSSNPIAILLTINVILLVVGTFMDMTPAVLIFTPILMPVAIDIGIEPIHFGIIMITNLSIGLCTPPVGTCLFVGCGVGKANITSVSRQMIPFYIAMVLALIAISYIEPLSMWLPELVKSLRGNP